MAVHGGIRPLHTYAWRVCMDRLALRRTAGRNAIDPFALGPCANRLRRFGVGPKLAA